MKNVTGVLALAADSHELTETGWLSFARSEPYASIIASSAFKRLHHISFLGALDYAFETAINGEQRSRAQHSLHVAGLANYIATQRGYCEDLKRHIIVAALLHDIGHAPLSHSVEPYTKHRLRVGHHELNERIINGYPACSASLRKALSESVNTDIVLGLIDCEASIEGGDLFSSAINIDTIDGIVRSFAYLKRGPIDSHANRLNVAQASFLHPLDPMVRQSLLDRFWSMKHQVYSHLIHSRTGLLADSASQYFFAARQKDLKESDLYLTERDWKKRFKELFDAFDSIRREQFVPDWLDGRTVEFKRRRYLIDSEKSGKERYAFSKLRDSFEFRRPQAGGAVPVQYSLALQVTSP